MWVKCGNKLEDSF